ncbi:MAG TPA: PAS-domain containing protein, partial [Alphaproteobacteria bacterium]|nr:PAS-domain containing protein [Alphaproteobacteria bacterium]
MMVIPPIPENESRRIEALRKLRILDTEPEERFDRLTRIAKHCFRVPIALVSLVDADRQWFKSRQGLDVTETERSASFCAHGILQDDVFYIEDALQDARFQDNPLVLGHPHIRFYAGRPLSAPDGSKVGTLCLIDTKPRRFSETDFDLLDDIARCVEAELTYVFDLERAKSEAAAKTRVLEATFENMSQGIAVFDADHKLVEVNHQYSEIVGFPPGFIHVGMDRRDIIRFRLAHGYYGDAGIPDGVEARVAGAANPESAERTHPDGGSYSYTRTPMPDGGYILTVTDTTDRRNAEQQLQQAQKMEAVGQLTGGIAHDFNNLLAISQGNLELAQEAAQNSRDVQPYLTTIKRANERGAALTNQLLAFSRKQTLTPEAVDAGALVEGMSCLLRRTLKENIEIEVSGDDGLWRCSVDPHQLESAIVNLAINARDAMPGGGTLSIRTANVDLKDGDEAAQAGVAPGEYVRVSVSDTGIGIPGHMVQQIFEPFYTTKEIGHGTGLGLSMVYGFVMQSGGLVTVESKEGRGATFHLYLPRGEVMDGQDRNAGKEVKNRAPGETVLVVEDDPDVRAMSVSLLESLGYGIIEAEDGPAALKALDDAGEIKLLFSDVVLPGGMSGPELAQKVLEDRPDMAVLYTSGYTDLVNFDKTLVTQEAEFLRKPFRKEDLAH